MISGKVQFFGGLALFAFFAVPRWGKPLAPPAPLPAWSDAASEDDGPPALWKAMTPEEQEFLQIVAPRIQFIHTPFIGKVLEWSERAERDSPRAKRRAREIVWMAAHESFERRSWVSHLMWASLALYLVIPCLVFLSGRKLASRPLFHFPWSFAQSWLGFLLAAVCAAFVFWRVNVWPVLPPGFWAGPLCTGLAGLGMCWMIDHRVADQSPDVKDVFDAARAPRAFAGRWFGSWLDRWMGD